jgi:hypothetical protein
VIDNGSFQDRARPLGRARIQTFASCRLRRQRRNSFIGGSFRSGSVTGSTLRIARRAVGAVNEVVFDHTPEGARIARANELALVLHCGGAADKQLGMDDVGVDDYPAGIGGGPQDLSESDAVEEAYRSRPRDGVPAVVTNDALGLSGRPRGVGDV